MNYRLLWGKRVQKLFILVLNFVVFKLTKALETSHQGNHNSYYNLKILHSFVFGLYVLPGITLRPLYDSLFVNSAIYATNASSFSICLALWAFSWLLYRILFFSERFSFLVFYLFYPFTLFTLRYVYFPSTPIF